MAITKFEVMGTTIIMDGNLQDNTSMAVTPGNRTEEILNLLEGSVDEYGVLMSPPERVTPAGVGLALTKQGIRVKGFFPSAIKRRPEGEY